MSSSEVTFSLDVLFDFDFDVSFQSCIMSLKFNDFLEICFPLFFFNLDFADAVNGSTEFPFWYKLLWEFSAYICFELIVFSNCLISSTAALTYKKKTNKSIRIM